MRRLCYTILASSIAVATVALLSVSATARTRLSNDAGAGLIRLTSSRLTFAGNVNIICDITLSASLQRATDKRTGAVAGGVSEGAARNCVNEFGQREPETAARPVLPIVMQYDSITGTLPTITGGTARIEGGALIRTNILGRYGCLYSGTVPATARENPAARLSMGANRFSLARVLEGICPSEAELQGTLTLSRAVRSTLPE